MTYSFKNYSEDNVFKSPIIIEIVGNITAALMWPISLFLLLRELYKELLYLLTTNRGRFFDIK